MAWYNPRTWLQSNKSPEVRAHDVPTKVFIEKEDKYYEYSDTEKENFRQRLDDLIDGTYSSSNFIELFNSVPEVFAPVHEIASRVADARWELRKTWNDEVDFGNTDFNRLFSKPNVLFSSRDLIYYSVCYEILTGKTLWYFNSTTVFGEDVAKNIIAWWSLPSHKVVAELKTTFDQYSATSLDDFILRYRTVANGKNKYFQTSEVLPIFHIDAQDGANVNKCTSMLKGAAKAIKNLIPVYEARGTIYVKRGMMGFIKSNKKDASGSVGLTNKEKKAVNAEVNNEYGLTGGRSTIGVVSEDVDFIKTSMTIEEMQPFEETLADAVAIYTVLRVPTHLAPSKDKSTFNNADSEMKAFYESVIIPWAMRYAEIFTEKFKFDRRYIYPNFDHLKILQADLKEEANTAKTNGSVWLERWKNGACSLNEWITANKGFPGTGAIYEKKLLELEPEELDQVKSIMNLKMSTDVQQQQNPDPSAAN
jgi:hypothetical protein